MKKISVLFAAFAMILSTGIAKAQKVASMDYEVVLAAMPETKQMTTELESFTKSKADEINKQATAFQSEVDQYQKGAAAMTEAQRTAKENELHQKQQKIQDLQTLAQQDLGKKRETLLKPIIDKLNTTVAKVAKANGYDFVIDASALIYKGGPDATAAVKKELNLP